MVLINYISNFPGREYDSNQLNAVLVDRQNEVADTLTRSFFQELPASIVEQVIVPAHNDWIAYLLLSLLAGLSIIFFLFPEKLNSISSQVMIKNQIRTSERNNPGSGVIIQSYLFINYLATLSLFVFYILIRIRFIQDIPRHYFYALIIIAAAVFILYFYRIGLIWIFGKLFETSGPAQFQQKLYSSTDYMIGVILIPVLLLSIYTENNFPFFAGIIFVIIIHIFRWFQTFFLGKTISGVSTIHLIIYLCTLEIAPLLVVIRLMQTF